MKIETTIITTIIITTEITITTIITKKITIDSYIQNKTLCKLNYIEFYFRLFKYLYIFSS